MTDILKTLSYHIYHNPGQLYTPAMIQAKEHIERLEDDNARLRESVRRLLAICECEIGRPETERRMEAFDD